MKLIDLLRLRAEELDNPPEAAVYCVREVLDHLRQSYRTSGEIGLISAINTLTEEAFAYVQRRVAMPEPLVPHVPESDASRIADELREAAALITAMAVAASRSAKERGF